METAIKQESTQKSIILISNSNPKKPKEKKSPKPRGTCKAVHCDIATDHSADAFTEEEEINKIVRFALSKGQYHKAVMFITGINTGYRAGDLICLTVKDVTGENGEIVKYLTIMETKTGTVRYVYLNEAVRTALKFLIEEQNLKPSNFLFTGDGNRKSYIVEYICDEEGNVKKVITGGEKFDENGNEREAAPMLVSSIGRWLVGLTKELGLEGHYSSHAMRQTFREFGDRLDPEVRVTHDTGLAQALLGHACRDTTAKHYMKKKVKDTKQAMISLNLGLQALQEYIVGKNNEQLMLF